MPSYLVLLVKAENETESEAGSSGNWSGESSASVWIGGVHVHCGWPECSISKRKGQKKNRAFNNCCQIFVKLLILPVPNGPGG